MQYYDFGEISRQMQAMASAVNRIETSGLSELLARMQDYQDIVDRYLAVADVAGRQANLFRATQSLHGLNEVFSAAEKHLDILRDLDNRIHSSWMLNLTQMPLTAVKLADAAQLALSTASLRTAHADRILNSIDFGFLEQFRKAQHALSIDLEASLSDFTLSYRSLVESIASVDSLLQLPSFVLPGASRKLYTTAYALDVLTLSENRSNEVTVEEDTLVYAEEDFESAELVCLLERVDPGLATMYTGALEAQRGYNPDRARHVLTSLRELTNQLLRKLAANEVLQEWIPKQANPRFLDNKKQPTRYARYRYILRDFPLEPLNNFVERGARTLLDLFDVYNRLHKQDPGINDIQLRAITIDAESNLLYILKFWATSKE